MTQINEFRCDSCQKTVRANWNGEHFLPPDGWVELMEVTTMQKVAHLCGTCRDVAFSMDLSKTRMGKAIVKESKKVKHV